MIEFLALVLFILAVFLVFQKYIVRGFSGRWKSVGDTLGGGQVYDPLLTKECAYDPQYTSSWFDQICYENNCEDSCLRSTKTAAACTACITACHRPYCD